MVNKKKSNKQIAKKRDHNSNDNLNQDIPKFIEIKDDYILIHANIKPNNKVDEIFKDEDILIIKTTSTPVKGKANKAIIKSLSKFFDINSNSIEIVVGHTSHNKILKVNKPYNIESRDFVKKISLKFIS